MLALRPGAVISLLQVTSLGRQFVPRLTFLHQEICSIFWLIRLVGSGMINKVMVPAAGLATWTIQRMWIEEVAKRKKMSKLTLILFRLKSVSFLLMSLVTQSSWIHFWWCLREQFSVWLKFSFRGGFEGQLPWSGCQMWMRQGLKDLSSRQNLCSLWNSMIYRQNVGTSRVLFRTSPRLPRIREHSCFSWSYQ